LKVRTVGSVGTTLALFIFLLLTSPARGEGSAVGEALYRERCAQCHDAGLARAPQIEALRQMPRRRIFLALMSGTMSTQAEGLTGEQIDSLVTFLGGARLPTPTAAPDTACAAPSRALADPLAEPHWNGWGVSPLQHRFQPAAMAKLAPEDVPRLKLKWAFGFAGDTRAQAHPTVLGGRVFVGSIGGKVYALDAKSGCTYWTFDAQLGVRSAISIGAGMQGWVAYFGDRRANAYALDAETGRVLWKTNVEGHRAAVITGAPTLDGDVLYVPVASGEEVLGASPNYPCCSFRGSVVALYAASGKLRWKAYTIRQEPQPVRKNAVGVQLVGPSGAAIWSSPTVDRAKRRIYVTTGDNYSDPPSDTSDAFLAFDMDTGELLWARQMTAGDAYTVDCSSATPVNCPQAKGPDLDFGSSAILVDLGNGRRALVAGQKSGVVHAIDPDRDGAILWQRRIGRGGTLGGVQWGSATDGENVYVALSDVTPRRVAEGTPGAQKPAFGGGVFRAEPNIGGGLFALKLTNGEIVWHTSHPGCGDIAGCSPAQSAAVTAIPGVIFSGGLDGHLRAYAAENGKIVWDVDTKQEYATVNGVAARGGSLDGPGAVVVDGMVYVNSGYTNFGTIPGNVLLAFSVDGK
jgi:polyvinyl alcohol dehydrogenase (cytochrome)